MFSICTQNAEAKLGLRRYASAYAWFNSDR